MTTPKTNGNQPTHVGTQNLPIAEGNPCRNLAPAAVSNNISGKPNKKTNNKYGIRNAAPPLVANT